jgi:hypothetical protein
MIGITNTSSQDTLICRGLIAGLSEEQQKLVKTVANKLKMIVTSHGEPGLFALSLAALELKDDLVNQATKDAEADRRTASVKDDEKAN